MSWSPDQVLAAVQEVLSPYVPWQRGWRFESAELDGEFILIKFRPGADQVFGVHYPLTDLPRSEYTGEPCETPQEWAAEVGLDIDEQVGTGEIATARSTVRPDGLVLLGWHGSAR